MDSMLKILVASLLIYRAVIIVIRIKSAKRAVWRAIIGRINYPVAQFTGVRMDKPRTHIVTCVIILRRHVHPSLADRVAAGLTLCQPHQRRALYSVPLSRDAANGPIPRPSFPKNQYCLSQRTVSPVPACPSVTAAIHRRNILGSSTRRSQCVGVLCVFSFRVPSSSGSISHCNSALSQGI